MVVRDTIFNLLGQGLPAVVAVFAIPVVTRSIGAERFGALTLIWVIIGYSGVFDLGLGRALTKLVAERLEQPLSSKKLTPLIWTALSMMTAMASLGALILIGISDPLIGRILANGANLRSEVLTSFRIMALTLPFIVLSAGLAGVLEAAHRFDLTNGLRVVVGVSGYLSPLAILPFSHSLVPLTVALALSRLIAALAHFHLCLRILPQLKSSFSIQTGSLKPLFQFGGWMTVSGVVSPIMVSFDRFLLGGLVSPAAVAYYATPQEVLSRFLIFPTAVVNALFPTFSADVAHNRAKAQQLFYQSVSVVIAVMFLATVVASAFADESLRIWLGAEFASNGAAAMKWLATGIFINSIGRIAFTFLQAAGLPEKAAKLHLCEVVPYAVLLWWLTHRFGITGAAIAWTARMACDTAIMMHMSGRILDLNAERTWRLSGCVVYCVLALAICSIAPGFATRAGSLFITLFGFVFICWFMLLKPLDRRLATTRFASLRVPWRHRVEVMETCDEVTNDL